ncbi:hypothetical protein Q604_UNBC17967G0001, partial [human gut metagenome]
VNPTKNGMKSTAFSTICFKRMAIPTHGRREPTVKRVFIGIPSNGRAVFKAVTASAPNLHIISVGKNENTKCEIQGKPQSTMYRRL